MNYTRDWQLLCEEIVHEQNPERLLQLVDELNCVLAQRDGRKRYDLFSDSNPADS